MLKLISFPGEMPWDGLERVYGEAVDRSFLRCDFFRKPGAMVCLWLEGDEVVCALRLEPWKDGFLLAALQTAPTCRRCGYARSLLRAVQRYVREQECTKLYSHIHHRNMASIRLHAQCGFQKISDTAALLDGTITAQMGTYLCERS